MEDAVKYILIGGTLCATFGLIWLYYNVILPKRDLESLRNKLKITDELTEMLDLVETRLNSDDEQISDVRLKKSERDLMTVTGCSLVEPRRAPAKYEAGHSGVSVRIAKGVHWRVGRSKARRVPQDDILKIIDEGVLHITNQRAVFTGTKQNREWRWDKLLNYSHDSENFSSIIHVSTRQKGSGIAHVDSDRDTAIICFSIDVGVASFYDEVPELRTKLFHEKNTIKDSIHSMEE